MADLIDRNALLTVPNIRKVDIGNGVHYLVVPVHTINAAPAVDATPVVHARWIGVPDPRHREGRCSLCGWFNHIAQNFAYCPNCGAKMDGGAEDASD